MYHIIIVFLQAHENLQLAQHIMHSSNSVVKHRSKAVDQETLTDVIRLTHMYIFPNRNFTKSSRSLTITSYINHYKTASNIDLPALPLKSTIGWNLIRA